MKAYTSIFWLMLVSAAYASSAQSGRTDDSFASVVLKTCKGCALDSYPTVIQFIKYDAGSFRELSIDYKAGGIPRLVVRNQAGEDRKVLDISKLSLLQIRAVMKKLGFEPSVPLEPKSYVEKRYKEDQLENSPNLQQPVENSLDL